MVENATSDLMDYCVHRVAMLDAFAARALWLALLVGAITAGLAVWKTYREIAAAKPGGGRDNRSALPGGLDTLITAISAAPVWVGLFGVGIALAYTANGFSERVCQIQPAPPPVTKNGTTEQAATATPGAAASTPSAGIPGGGRRGPPA